MSTPKYTYPAVSGSHPQPIPKATLFACGTMIVLGIIGFVMGHATNPARAWQAYMVNFLFFLGIASGGALFSSVVHMASGHWGRNVKRIAEGLGSFLPIIVFLFLLMIPGFKHLFPWSTDPYGPSWWLDTNFLAIRNSIALWALAFLGSYQIYRSLRVDIGTANENGGAYNSRLHRFITRNWQGVSTESLCAKKSLGFCAPIYTMLFAGVLTLVAMDLVMSLKKDWYSTLIGGYFFVGCFYIALATLMVAVIWTRRRFGLHNLIRANHLHDIAKLTMAFGIVTADFFYSQLLLIWYGNLPVETSFVIDRWHGTPWRFVGIAIMLACFVLPILAMIHRGLKEKALPMLIFSFTVLLGMWTERLFLVAPSISGTESILFGLTEILITLGFVGLLSFVFVLFIYRVPPVTLHDPVLGNGEEIL